MVVSDKSVHSVPEEYDKFIFWSVFNFFLCFLFVVMSRTEPTNTRQGAQMPCD